MPVDSKQETNSDFRDKTVWIYIVMFEMIAVLNWRHQPTLSWIGFMAVLLFLPLAVHFQIKKRRIRLVQGKG